MTDDVRELIKDICRRIEAYGLSQCTDDVDDIPTWKANQQIGALNGASKSMEIVNEEYEKWSKKFSQPQP